MNIIVSQLPFLGCLFSQMKTFPPEYGIEIFIEFGSEFFWKHTLPEVLEGRTGRFSVHGPYMHTNLASPETDWDGVVESYKWTYELCRRYSAAHCVLHPNGSPPKNISRSQAQELSFVRVEYLSKLAGTYGVEVLVENMPHKDQVFGQDEFVDTFSKLDTIDFLIDTGHALVTRWDMTKLLKKLNTRIKAYHIHDNMGDCDSHLKVGEGIMDWSSFFAAVKKYTPEASLVLEYYSNPVEEIIKSIELVKQYIL